MSANSLISVVDDDYSMLRMLERVLAAEGFEVACFGSAEEFLSSGRGNDSACLILDVDLPGISGLELQQHLNDLGQGIPVTIIISGQGTNETRQRALKAGAAAFFNKPFNIDSLLATVHSVESLSLT